jgi:hypothetical protein
LGEWGAWYEFYLKQSWDDYVHLQLGKQMVPWGLTQVFSLGDRLQPSYRTPGIAFLEPVKGSEPLWGLAIRSQLNIFSSEMVLMMPWNAERNDINTSSQGHFQVGRYQEGLNVGPPTVSSSRYSDAMQKSSVLDQLALGGRIEGQVDEVTLGGSVVWGPDQTPHLTRAGSSYNALTLGLDPLFTRPECISAECDMGDGLDLFRRDKVASVAVEATWSLGLAIFKLEWLHYLAEIPNMGKIVWLWGDSGLQSQHAAMDALVVAMESGLGEWIEGSVEAGVFRWGNLPSSHQLFGVQALVADAGRALDVYYRPVLGARLHGYVWQDWVSWSWVNETGVLTQDTQNKLEIALHWPSSQVYVGVFGEKFEGVVGTPGYFRSGRDRAGVMIGGGPW